MKNSFVEWDEKLRNFNQYKQNINEDEDVFKITKKTEKKFESLIKANGQNKLIAWVPTILIWWMVIACFLYPGIDMNEVRKSRPVLLVGPFLTIIWLCIVFYNERNYKRLYHQVCDWTITIKQLDIIEFRRYGSLSKEYKRNEHWYRVIASDWEKKYKSNKYSDQYLWIYHSPLQMFTHDDELKINGKTYHIWDKIVVYIDSGKESNYYLDI
jgi:hypothetical protein